MIELQPHTQRETETNSVNRITYEFPRKITDKNVLVIGDSCTDVFVYGNCDRLAPEAPVPVFHEVSRNVNSGMAGNVKENLEAIAKRYKIDINVDLLTNKEKITKTRYMDKSSNHLIMRIDDEKEVERINLDDVLSGEFDLSQYDAVIVSDYNKGFLSEVDINMISRQARTFLDTKKYLGNWAKDVEFIKINKHEHKKHMGDIPEELDKRLIITYGEEGCMYMYKIYPTRDVPISDISGAGDTFMAGFVFNYLQTDDPVEAIDFAQMCASKVVSKRGVSTI